MGVKAKTTIAHPRLILLLAAIAFILFVAVIALAYQNYRLRQPFTSVSPSFTASLPSPPISTAPFKITPTVGSGNQSLVIKYAPKSSWQTYTDKVAGFSLQYNTNPIQPYNLYQALGINIAGKNVSIMTCNTPLGGPNANKEICLEAYSVSIYDSYSGGSRHQWFTQNIQDYPACQRYYADLALASKNALLVTSNCSSWGETYILVPGDSRMIVFLVKGYIRNDSTGKIVLPEWLKETLSTFAIN